MSSELIQIQIEQVSIYFNVLVVVAIVNNQKSRLILVNMEVLIKKMLAQ